jgi:hypothetical protein
MVRFSGQRIGIGSSENRVVPMTNPMAFFLWALTAPPGALAHIAHALGMQHRPAHSGGGKNVSDVWL